MPCWPSRRCPRACPWPPSAWTTPATPPCWRPESSTPERLGVIERYTRPAMRSVWSEQRRLEPGLGGERAGGDALAGGGVIPAAAAAPIRERAAFPPEAVSEREKVTDHDVAAFVDVVAESVG